MWFATCIKSAFMVLISLSHGFFLAALGIREIVRVAQSCELWPLQSQCERSKAQKSLSKDLWWGFDQVQRPGPSHRPSAVLILSSCEGKLSFVCFDALPRLGKQSLALTYWGHVWVHVHAYSEEMDVISHSLSCLKWTLGWNTSLRELCALQCVMAYLITVQPKARAPEQTHSMIDVIMFHLWLS